VSNISIIQSCDSPFVIHYIDNSFNNPTSWNWEFEGGNPATSTEESPYITYAVAGAYQVKQIAINDFGADTSIQEIFINGHQNEFLNPTICEGDSLTIAGFVFNEAHPSGEIQLFNAMGCDTILHVSLNFEASHEIFLTDSIEIGATYIVGGSTYNVAGNYTDSLTSVNGCDSIVHLELSVYDPTSIIDLDVMQNMHYYPNPVTDWINFSFQLTQKTAVRVAIFDISGKQIASIPEKTLPIGHHVLSHDLHHSPSGVYFAKVISNTKVWTVRFVK